ncbi:MAG TPA: GNAT family N-acetyltransferase [Capsulimonadaceae bacterium]|nr:GNAT family N-acetyltransferase [Capsulimonadaceae bacterium]
MATEYHIRRATPADIPILAELRLDFLRETASFFKREVSAALEKATRDYLSKAVPSGDFIAWLAEADGQVVATSGLVFFQRPPTPGSLSGLDAYVLNMYTLPDWRGKGIATALLKQIIEYVKTTPARRVSLRATDAGRAIYDKFGFRVSGDYMDLVLAGE